MTQREKRVPKREPTQEELHLKRELDASREEYAKAFRQISHREVKNKFVKKLFNVKERKQHKFRTLEDEYIRQNPESPLKALRDDYEKKCAAFLAAVLREGGEQEALYQHRLEAATLINAKLRWRAVAVMGRVISSVVKPLAESKLIRGAVKWTADFIEKHPGWAAVGILVVATGIILAIPTTLLVAMGIGATTGISYRLLGGMDVEDYLRGKSGWFHKFKNENERIEYAAKHQRNTKVQASILSLMFGGVMRALRGALAAELGITRAGNIFRKWLGSFVQEVVGTKSANAAETTASTVATQSSGQSQLVGGRQMQPVRAGATELAYDFQNDPITVRAYYAKEESYTIIQNIWPSLMQAKQDMLNKLDALLADGVDTMRDQALKARYLANLQAFDDLCQKIIYRMDTLEMLSKAGDMFVNDPAEYAKTYRFHGWPPPDEMQRLMAGRAQMVQELEQMNRQAHDLDKVIKQDMQTIKSLPVLKRGAALLSGEAAQGDSSFVNASHDARDTGHFVPLSLETLTVDQILDKCDAISAATTTEQFNIGKIIASLHDFESRFISTRSSSAAWTSVFEGDYKKLLGLEAKLDDLSQQYADLGGRAEDVATALREEEITKEEAARQLAEIQKDMNALHAKRDLLLGQIEDTKKSIASKVKLPPPGADGNGPETAPHKRDDGVGKEIVYRPNDGDASFQTLASTDEPRLRGAQPDDNSYQNDPYRGGTGPKPHELSPDELLAVRQAAWQQFAEIRDQYYASFPKGLKSLVESLMGLPNGRGTAQSIDATIQAINRKMDVYAHAIEDALKHVKGSNTVEASAEVREILDQMKHDPELAALVRRLYALQAEGSDIVDTFTRGPKVIPAVYDGTDGAPFELVSQKTNNINPDIGKMRITPENADTIGRIGNMGVGDIDSVQTYQEFLNQQNQKVQASLATLLRRIAALKAIAGTSAATSPQELALLQAQVEVVSSKVGEQVAKSATGVLESDTFMDLQLGPSNLQREAARMVNELWKPIFALDAKLNAIDAALKAEGIQRTITPPPGTIGA